MVSIGGILSPTIVAAASLFLFMSLNIAFGENCYSGLVVEVVPSSGTPSLDGFHISINGQLVTNTNSRGSATIPLSEDLTGDISIEAEKNDRDGTYYGSGGVNIPCVDSSGRKYARVSIEVSFRGTSPEPPTDLPPDYPEDPSEYPFEEM